MYTLYSVKNPDPALSLCKGELTAILGRCLVACPTLDSETSRNDCEQRGTINDRNRSFYRKGSGSVQSSLRVRDIITRKPAFKPNQYRLIDAALKSYQLFGSLPDLAGSPAR